MNCSMPGLPVHHQLPEFTQTHVHWVSDAIQPSHPLSTLFLLPPTPPSIRVFSNESTLRMRWPKYWSFSISIIPSKEHPGLISFRMDWLDLLAVQGTLKSLLQHHSSKASILRGSDLKKGYITSNSFLVLLNNSSYTWFWIWYKFAFCWTLFTLSYDSAYLMNIFCGVETQCLMWSLRFPFAARFLLLYMFRFVSAGKTSKTVKKMLESWSVIV